MLCCAVPVRFLGGGKPDIDPAIRYACFTPKSGLPQSNMKRGCSTQSGHLRSGHLPLQSQLEHVLLFGGFLRFSFLPT